MKTVTSIASHRYKIRIIPEAEKNLSEFSSFRICPYAKYENLEISEISVTLLFCSKTVKKSMKTVTTIASHRYKNANNSNHS